MTMKKTIALLCVVSWSGFWAFGYLALSSPSFDDAQVIVAALVAGAGFLTGIATYLMLCRGNC